MNRKQFILLLIVLGVLGGIGLGLVWQNSAAYRASACAFVQTQYSLGLSLAMEYVARHFAKRAPSPRYSSRRARQARCSSCPRLPMPPLKCS